MHALHLTLVRVDATVIAHNVRLLCAATRTPLLAVVKAGGYGHGALTAARACLAGGASGLCIGSVAEARELRAGGVDAPLLLLGALPSAAAREVVALDITCAVFDLATARALGEAGAALGVAPRVHLKVDTGMHRLGVATADAPALLAHFHQLQLDVTGIFTHFATADESGHPLARQQLDVFTALLTALSGAGLRPPVAHAANSAALLAMPDARLDAARPGIACYGVSPAAAIALPDGVRPALTWQTAIAQTRWIAPGESVSYGASWVARRPSLIATIQVGYADGLRRNGWRAALVRGRRAPVVGRISMDYTMLDITDCGGAAGDEVVLIGRQGDAEIDAWEAAGWCNTIAYELLTGIASRVARVEVSSTLFSHVNGISTAP